MSGGTVTRAWPLQTHLELAALPTAPGCARDHVRAVTHGWGLSGLADTAELVVSELVTNAVQAYARMTTRADQTTVPVIGLWITSDLIALTIHVWDASPEMPVFRDTAPDEENGRGLMLVDGLSKEHGVYHKANGKVIWAMITANP